MEKAQYKKEINRILKEAKALEKKAQLDLETAEFLDNEAIILEKVIDDSNSLPEEKQSAIIKLEVLQKRILLELNEQTEDQTRLERELFVLNNKAMIEGLI